MFDANLNQVFSAIALRTLETYQVETPWSHQDTTTLALYGAYDEGRADAQGPRPAYGYSKDGRGDFKQVLLSLGVSGDGSLPLLLERPAKRHGDAPRRWYGRSVIRQVEVEDAKGHVAWAPIRFIAVYSTPLAPHHEHAHDQAQAREAQVLAPHLAHVQSRQFACEADAMGAIAAYEGGGPGRRGRAAAPWRSHEGHYPLPAHRQCQKRAQRGRLRQGEAPQEEVVDQLSVETQALAPAVETWSGLVLATTIDETSGGDAEMVQAYRDQTATVERGFRWLKNPAAISPVGLEKRQRIAALAMLTMMGLLVYGLIQRQVRQYVAQHEASVPSHKGQTDRPMATVVFEFFATVTRVELTWEDMTTPQLQGWQAHHELICQAVELDHSIYEVPTT